MARERIALVLAGGGARGAYEAGALSVVLPELERRGQRPTMYVGTSVGSLNAVALAAWHALPAADAVDRLVALWSAVDKAQVIKRILFPSGPLAVARYAGELLSVPGLRLPSVLDPSPLRANLERWIDWDGLHASVADGAVDAVAAVTTSTRSGRTVVFAEVPSPAEHRLHRSHEIAYVLAELGADHVSASAAIPLLFPPVRIESPARVRGWYVDGGTRLNAPIKPALDLGADRLVVVATDSIAGPGARAGRGRRRRRRAAGLRRRARPPARGRARRPADQGHAAARRDQRVPHATGAGGDAALSHRARQAPLPPDPVRVRRAGGARPDRRARRRSTSRPATAACAACATPTSPCSAGCSAARAGRTATS